LLFPFPRANGGVVKRCECRRPVGTPGLLNLLGFHFFSPPLLAGSLNAIRLSATGNGLSRDHVSLFFFGGLFLGKRAASVPPPLHHARLRWPGDNRGLVTRRIPPFFSPPSPFLPNNRYVFITLWGNDGTLSKLGGTVHQGAELEPKD